MTTEETLLNEILKKFPELHDSARVQRARRIIVDVAQNRFEEVFALAKHELDFTILCTITGLDEGKDIAYIYHLSRKDGIMLNIGFRTPKEKPVIKTVIKYFPSAEIYERELVDLLGVIVEGLPEGIRYPLPDDWPKDEHPLLKDWKPRSAMTSTPASRMKEETGNATA